MIGVVADDLTGAAELAGIGWRYGLQSEVVTAPGRHSEAELVCVDTDSRSCAPAEASERAAAAVRNLVASGASRIYKKVDSVLRGRIVAELESILKELQLPRALLVPANPTLGRVVRDGKYFVGGRPIHETDFRLDPEYPRHTSSVAELLGRTARDEVVPVCATRAALPVAGIVVGAAETTEDLQRWANIEDSGTLMAGAAQFFAALLESRGHRAGATANPPAPSTASELFVCGSASEACRSFVATERRRGVPVFGLPEPVARGTKLAGHEVERIANQVANKAESCSRIILEVGLPPVGDRDIARQLAQQLVQVAQAVLARRQFSQVYLEGGATGANLLQVMGWSRLTAVQEIAQGVVTFQIAGDSRRLTLKPGSYSWPAAVRR